MAPIASSTVGVSPVAPTTSDSNVSAPVSVSVSAADASSSSGSAAAVSVGVNKISSAFDDLIEDLEPPPALSLSLGVGVLVLRVWRGVTVPAVC